MRHGRRPLLLVGMLGLLAALATVLALLTGPVSEGDATSVVEVSRSPVAEVPSPERVDASDASGAVQREATAAPSMAPIEPLLGSPLQVRLRSLDPARATIRARFEYRIEGDDTWHPVEGRFAWPRGARDVLHVAAEKLGWGRAERSLRRAEYTGGPVNLILGRTVRHWGACVDAKGRPMAEKSLVVARAPDASGSGREIVRSAGGGRFPLPFDPATHPLVWAGRTVRAGLPIDTLAYVPTEVVRADPLEVRETVHTIVPMRLARAPSDVRWATALGTPGPVFGLVELDAAGRGFLALPGTGPLRVTLQVGLLSSEPFVIERSPRTVLSAIDVELSDRRLLGGVVVDAHGDPVEDAWVSVLDGADDLRAWPEIWDAARSASVPPPPSVVVTRADGAFTGLPYGVGTLVAFRPGRRPAAIATAGLGPETEALVLTLDEGALLVLDLSGGALASASGADALVVELTRRGGTQIDPARVVRAHVDGAGRVVFRGLATGLHGLRVLRGDDVLADESVDPSQESHVSIALRRLPRVRFSLPEDAPVPRAVRLVPRDGEGALLVPPGDDGHTFEVLVPWTGVADIERLAAQDAFLADVPARWIPAGAITVGSHDVVRVLPSPARALSVRVDARALRAPFLVVLCDPLRTGAPVVASARVESDAVVTLSGLPEGFLRVDVLEAPSGLRSGGAFVGQGTASVPERGLREVVVHEHDGVRAALGVRVGGATPAARAGLGVRARLSLTVLAEAVTDADGRALLDVPEDVRGVVELLDAAGGARGDVPATPYQSPGRREVLLRLGGGEAQPADR